MSDDTKKARDESQPESQPDLARRKLVYAAPVLVSQRLFNAVTGCGKVNPNVQSCALVAFSS
jgi:hypothetical protein